MAGVVAFRLLADAVLVVHAAFIVFVAVGALLAWRWPRIVWAHLPAAAWGVGIVTVGWDCPLTPLEKWLRRRSGEDVYRGGFVDRYVEGVVYPEELTPLLRAMAAAAVVVGYVGLLKRRGIAEGLRRSEHRRPRPVSAPGWARRKPMTKRVDAPPMSHRHVRGIGHLRGVGSDRGED